MSESVASHNGGLSRSSASIQGHLAYVAEMKKDLESVLRRIRNLKTKMAAQNPEAFQGTKHDRVVLLFSILITLYNFT